MELQFSDVSPGQNFYAHRTLYLGYGHVGSSSAFYAGTTTRTLKRRDSEHGSGSKDRRYCFIIDGYLAWELPTHWGTRSTESELALAEDLLIYSLCRTLRGTGHWLDNRRYNTKVRKLSEKQVDETCDFMRDHVYPRIEERFNLTIQSEPRPAASTLHPGYWFYVNGSKGSGPRNERVGTICSQSGWIFNRA